MQQWEVIEGFGTMLGAERESNQGAAKNKGTGNCFKILGRGRKEPKPRDICDDGHCKIHSGKRELECPSLVEVPACSCQESKNRCVCVFTWMELENIELSEKR